MDTRMIERELAEIKARTESLEKKLAALAPQPAPTSAWDKLSFPLVADGLTIYDANYNILGSADSTIHDVGQCCEIAAEIVRRLNGYRAMEDALNKIMDGDTVYPPDACAKSALREMGELT